MNLNNVNRSRHNLPSYSTNLSAVKDIEDNIEKNILLTTNEGYVLTDREGLCRMVISKHEKAEWISPENLIISNRGEGEFGHTGNE